MKVYTYDAEQQNDLATASMYATVNALRDEGLLEASVAKNFVDQHVCQVANGGIFERVVHAIFGKPASDDQKYCVILKIISK